MKIVNKNAIHRIKFLVVFVGMLALTACYKQLDQQPISDLTDKNFYSNTNDFLQAVNGTYSKLTSYPSQVLWLGEMRSDNINAIHDGNRDWQGVNDFLPTITTTGFILSAWRDNFNGIFNANSTLEALGTKGSVITDGALKTRFEGEVRFLRAFYYFQLIKLFGPVPLITSPLSADEVATVPRSEPADIYPIIIEDLTFAGENLPESYDAANLGRATKYAAKALLGLVYLTRSGPSYQISGPGQDSQEYDKALGLFNEVIASGQFGFLPAFSDIFNYDNENNQEVIFDVQFMSSSNGASFPSHLAPVAFWTDQKLSNAFGNGYGSSSFQVSNSLRKAYEQNANAGTDLREAFSIRLSYKSPFIQKYIDVDKRGLNGKDWSINFIVLRYTDILLMKAECILQGAGGSTQEALDAVNQVRSRAGLTSFTSLDLHSLLEERRREFVGEGLRWNDLIRFGKAVETINQWKVTDDLSNIQTIDANALIYPVPADELSVKQGLYTQNPGY